MTLQYLRACSLTAGGVKVVQANGDDNQLRVTFRIQHAELGNPQNAVIKIYNLKPATEQKLMKERLKVDLEAGYRDGFGLIFSGEVIQAIIGRENPVDTTVTLVVKNADTAHNYGVVNKSLSAGHTWKDRVDAALGAMQPYGVTAGHIDDLGSKKFPRGFIMSGMAKDLLREIAFATGSTWSVQNSKLQVVKNNKALPGEAVVLNSRTGLIGRPDQTINGIQGRCLLNPKIRPGTKLKIDQASINKQQFSADYTAEVNNAMIPDVAADGVYKVLYVDEVGDTRGGPWYTEFVCLAAQSDKIPLGLAQRGIVDKATLDQEFGRG